MGITTAITAGLEGLGVGATTAGIGATALEGAGLGAGLGGIESGLTGQNVGKGILHGAEGGALTGGGIGLGGDLLGGTIGATAADALGGAAGGALGSELTGGKPLTGALEGGVSGGIAGSGILSSGTPSTTSAAGGPGTSAGGSAAPAGVSANASGIDDSLSQQTLPTDSGNLPNLSGVGSSATSSGNIGTGTTGTQSLPSGLDGGNLGSQISSAATGAQTPAPSSLPNLSTGETAAPTPTSVQNLVNNFSGANAGFNSTNLSNLGNVVTSNPGAAISAAGLGLDVLKQNQSLEGERQLKQEASNLAGQGSQLEGYLQSGTLPPGLQAGINQASDAAIATIKSQYAARGMSGSSAEQQDIAAVQSRAEAQGAQMAMQLLQTGISETGMASGLYEQLLNQATQSDAQLGSAISNFASAAAGGGNIGKGGVTINYPQA